MNHPRAGQPAQAEDLVDVDALVGAYYDRTPGRRRTPTSRSRSARRGTAGRACARRSTRPTSSPRRRPSCEYRVSQGFDGPLFIGRDTHGLSEPAWKLGPRGARRQRGARCSSTTATATRRPRPCRTRSSPLNRGKAGTGSGAGLADGIVVTPSHNPPADGGFKYNPPHGGPADTDATSVIAARANELIRDGLEDVRRVAVRPGARARPAPTTSWARYVDDLPNVVDLAAHPRGRRAHRRRPARRRLGRLLGRDRRAARPRPHRRQPARRPAVGRS